MAKKLLFLMNSMQGYEDEIIKGLENRGFEVDWYKNSSKIPKQDLTFFKRIIRSLAEDFEIKKFRELLFEIENKYYSEEMKKLNKNYDYIIDIGSKSSPNFMKILNKNYKSKKKLFIWDDLRYDRRSEELISYFDKVYSYCPEDANKFKLIYRPSFYTKIFVDENEKKDLDIFYIGNMRERERTIIIKKIDELFPNLNKKIKLCGSFKLKYLNRYLSVDTYKKYFIQEQFNIKELSEFYKSSKSILDITIKSQIGLGLRPIEAIGAKCKLITTNGNIKNYDFYNENNIFVLNKDFSNLEKLKEFMNKPYLEYSDEIKYKYSLDGFIDDIFKE